MSKVLEFKIKKLKNKILEREDNVIYLFGKKTISKIIPIKENQTNILIFPKKEKNIQDK